ncbi:hypothetical protein [Streptomyces sp. TLI_171]|uniref:hypothetical protein n=1 Tax=Streptomyces sp. TLI_171 TaxID=1938859 RepID=UPI000C1A6386|nr:hypothetical protein [Streptomyces sp. TLI_171]RKE02994.1 hypothetical protein BX266_7601 [Streptomyces sp. TLI_171]
MEIEHPQMREFAFDKTYAVTMTITAPTLARAMQLHREYAPEELTVTLDDGCTVHLGAGDEDMEHDTGLTHIDGEDAADLVCSDEECYELHTDDGDCADRTVAREEAAA